MGGLDICINSAGIGNPVPFYNDQSDGSRSWRYTINVNLIAVIGCTPLAVGSVTAICFTCFLLRCFVVVLSAFDTDASLDVLDHPILNLIYYMLVEILPSALVLYILRKLPPKRVSAQYHPIR